MNLRNVAKPIMEELAKQTDETVILEVVDGFHGLCIEKVESSQSMKCTSQVGKRVPLHAGAPTKILMAYLPAEKIEQIIEQGLQKFTESTVTEPDILRNQLEEIRQKGYCISNGELDLGSLGIAFPIRNHEGKVIAAISVVGPEFRVADKINQFLLYCQSAAAAISQQLGGM
jgi:DNA-binding IclR family transcriptional regulator